ncbi:PP2C family serine/threonine-protein phosphatase [Cellulomonas sp. KRMCY2]|uniref:PP2C family protein-serine/threonine phosphatase n=1 Tax=Cellulomonas sp. KRMCY2 TaxID=1304865 RepID=UPI0004BB3DD8|nr:protein phosphatase 2C domain-containing protein [Cellulomonas sp. KRMCY2]
MRSVTGPYRSANQDSVGCSSEYVFVADGVGGHAGGDVASWTVTHRLMSLLAPVGSGALDVEGLRTAIARANADLALRVQREPSLAGMATTFTGVFCADNVVRVAHIGDSRAYLVRDGQGRQVTRDDSLVQMLLDSGAISDAEADHHLHRNVIVRSLAGAPDDAHDVTVLIVPAQVGDRWLVASDGLTDYVPETEILAALITAPGPDAAADALIAAATAADSRDNISVAVSDVVSCEEGGSPDARPYRYLGAAASPESVVVGDLSRPARPVAHAVDPDLG